MKNVLVLTDFSETANLASNLGIMIAKKLHAGITFLHLISTPVEWKNLPLEKENLYPETKAAIGDAKDKLFALERSAESSGVEAHTSLLFNHEIGEVYRYINKKHYDLVVIGTHGEKGKNKAVGSNTLKVIHKSPVPVIAVKSSSRIEVPKRWLIVSDFHEKSRQSFDVLMEMGEKLEASVQLLYVNTPYYFAETTEINQKLEKFTGPYSHREIKLNIFNAFNEERGIQAFMESENFDMVSVITHGQSGLNPVFRRSITEKILNHLDLPVMSINADIKP